MIAAGQSPGLEPLTPGFLGGRGTSLLATILKHVLNAFILLCILQVSAQYLSAQLPNPGPQAPKTAPDEARKPPAGASHADEAAPRESLAPVHTFLYLFTGAGLAVFLGIGRLLKRFYSFLGLGVVLNPWTGIFLVLVGVSAACSHLMLLQTIQSFSAAVTSSRMQPLLAILGGVLGNLSSVLGRLRKSRTGTEAASEVKDLEQLKSDNLFIKFICRRIRTGMNREIDRMAKRYDWHVIKPTVSRLLQNERALEPSQANEEAEKYVLAFQPSTDSGTDIENRYRALQRVVGVTSFLELRSRLADAAEAA